jgi:hypothetical protein
MTGLESTKLPEPKGAHGKDGVTRRGRGSGACRLVAMGPSTGPRDAGNPVVVTQWAGMQPLGRWTLPDLQRCSRAAPALMAIPQVQRLPESHPWGRFGCLRVHSPPRASGAAAPGGCASRDSFIGPSDVLRQTLGPCRLRWQIEPDPGCHAREKGESGASRAAQICLRSSGPPTAGERTQPGTLAASQPRPE